MTRAEALTDEFMNWLGRYSPRIVLRANERAMADEVNALMRVIMKFAPASNYLAWLSRVTEQLDFQMKTQSWPTVSEIGAVCSNIAKERPGNSGQNGKPVDYVFDSYHINSQRMKNGEAVPEGYVFGREAVEMVRRGLMTMDVMRDYRSTWFFKMKDVYGEVEARRMETEMLRKHGYAEGLWADGPAHQPPASPVKRMNAA